MTVRLCPAQQKALDQMLEVLPQFPVVGLCGRSGAGKTTVLHAMRERTGGKWIAATELMHALTPSHPLAVDEILHQLLEGAFKTSDLVFLDDLSLLNMVMQGGCGAYPRPNFLNVVLESIGSLAEAR